MRTEPSDAWLSAPYDEQGDYEYKYEETLERFIGSDAYDEALAYFMYDEDGVPTGRTEDEFQNSEEFHNNVLALMAGRDDDDDDRYDPCDNYDYDIGKRIR